MSVLIIAAPASSATSSPARCSPRAAVSPSSTAGSLSDPFGDRVERLRGDRTTGDFARLLAGREWDAAVDFAAYTGADAAGAVEALRDRVGHYVLISTGQVYLVREGRPSPARETDYYGPVIPSPPIRMTMRTGSNGTGKRGAEDTLARAWRNTASRPPACASPSSTGSGIITAAAELPSGASSMEARCCSPAAGQPLPARLRRRRSPEPSWRSWAVPGTFGEAYNYCPDGGADAPASCCGWRPRSWARRPG